MAKKREMQYRKLPASLWPKFLDEFRRFWPTIVERNLTAVDAAKAIGIAIGFKELAPSTVRDAAKSDGKEWPGVRAGRPIGHSSNKVRALAQFVAHLYDRLGETRPERLNAIIRGQADSDDVDAAAGPLFGGDDPAA